MKVWLVQNTSNGGVSVYSEATDVAEIPFIKTELGYLEGSYEEEREDFLADVKRARERGYGQAVIEESLSVQLMELQQ